MLKVVFQGKEGAFSHIAGIKFFGERNTFYGVENFEDIFLALKTNKADFGIVPIENSIAGSVYENYDLLIKYKFFIAGELYLKISHNLLGIKTDISPLSKRLKVIKKVFSHYKALEQCNKFFRKHPWMEKVDCGDTAGAALLVSNSQNISYGAIASKFSAKIYDLDILLENIEDNQANYTRFLIIQKEKPAVNNSRSFQKCSLAFSLRHKPGSLYRTLGIFAQRGINLTKIESRPINGKPFEYLFYLDFEFLKGKDKINLFTEIINELKKETKKIFVLGLYNKGKNFLC